MRTITIQAPKGLQTLLLEILKPIKMDVKQIENQYWGEFTFIGTVSCPHAKIKNTKKGIYETIKLVSSEMGSYEKKY